MELKINFDEASLKESALRATILKVAVDHLLVALTPEALAVFLEKTPADALRGISSAEIQIALRPYLTTIVAEYVAQPEVKAKMVAAAQQGIESAISEYPATLRGTIMDMAKKSFASALETKARYG